ncbi:MAG: extracellular solute-binding protein [Caldilineaceae bacterium]|nr:extracellular solute-binding protein [Caldilineaceae bacterium]
MNEKNLVNRPLSRRQALKLMGGMAGMMALAACAAPAAAPSGDAGGDAAPMEAAGSMVVVHRREYFKEMEELFTEAVLAWGAANNVEIEVSPVAAEANEDFVAKLAAEVEAGNPPDLIYHRNSIVSQMYFLDLLTAVDDTAQQAMDAYGGTAAAQERFNVIDDQWWGVPYIMSGGTGAGVYARRSWLEEAGVDPVAGIKTFDDLRDVALAISDVEQERYGWGMTINRGGDATGLIQAIIHNWGGQIVDADLTSITFNSQETVDAVAWLTEVFVSDQYADMLAPGILSWTDSSNNEAWLAGNIGLTKNAASVYAQGKADGNPIFEDTLVTEPIVGPYGEALTGGDGAQFNIPRGAGNPTQAAELALHMLTPSVFLPISLISAGLFLPAYDDIYQMDEVVAAFEADPTLRRMGEMALGDYPGLSWPAQPNVLTDAVNAQSILPDLMAETVTAGVDPAEAVQRATDRMNQIAEELGAFS